MRFKTGFTWAGKVIFELNPDQKPYVVFDDHRDSPAEFRVKASVTKKNYVIQQRVFSSDRTVSEGKKPSSMLKVKVGNVSDFPSIDQAREADRQLVQTMITTKRNPNKIRREADVSELTMSEVFAQYRQHLLGRSKPAKQNTLNVLNKAEKRLSEWSGLRVKDLSGNEILRKFDEIASRARTAAELICP